MKIFVDKLPETDEECIFYKDYVCRLSGEKCEIEECAYMEPLVVIADTEG